MNFQIYLNNLDLLKEHKSLLLKEDFYSVPMQKISLGLPEIERTSLITILKNKSNPIFIQTKDGSKLFFTIDEFGRIEGVPQVGKTIKFKIQRRQDDNSLSPSKITSCRVMDS